MPSIISIEFWLLFAIAMALQITAIAIRRLSLSLFFSFLHSVFISLILVAMGHHWLGIANLWMTSGLAYFALIQTSLLIGQDQRQKPQRKITLSLLFAVIVVSSFTVLFSFTSPSIDPPYFSATTKSALPLITLEHGLIITLLALMTLSTLITVFLLIREDELLEKP